MKSNFLISNKHLKDDINLDFKNSFIELNENLDDNNLNRSNNLCDTNYYENNKNKNNFIVNNHIVNKDLESNLKKKRALNNNSKNISNSKILYNSQQIQSFYNTDFMYDEIGRNDSINQPSLSEVDESLSYHNYNKNNNILDFTFSFKNNNKNENTCNIQNIPSKSSCYEESINNSKKINKNDIINKNIISLSSKKYENIKKNIIVKDYNSNNDYFNLLPEKNRNNYLDSNSKKKNQLHNKYNTLNEKERYDFKNKTSQINSDESEGEKFKGKDFNFRRSLKNFIKNSSKKEKKSNIKTLINPKIDNFTNKTKFSYLDDYKEYKNDFSETDNKSKKKSFNSIELINLKNKELFDLDKVDINDKEDLNYVKNFKNEKKRKSRKSLPNKYSNFKYNINSDPDNDCKKLIRINTNNMNNINEITLEKGEDDFLKNKLINKKNNFNKNSNNVDLFKFSNLNEINPLEHVPSKDKSQLNNHLNISQKKRYVKNLNNVVSIEDEKQKKNSFEDFLYAQNNSKIEIKHSQMEINPNLNSRNIMLNKCNSSFNFPGSLDDTHRSARLKIKYENKRKIERNRKVYDSLSDVELYYLKEKFYMINSNSYFMHILGFFNLIICLYSITLLPINLIFAQNFNFIFFVLEIIFDFFFIIDFISGHFLGFFDLEENYVINPKFTALNYLRSYFIIDLISGLPFNSYLEYKKYKNFEEKENFKRLIIQNSNDNNIYNLFYNNKLLSDLIEVDFWSIKFFEDIFFSKLILANKDNIINILKLCRIFKLIKLKEGNSFINQFKISLKLQSFFENYYVNNFINFLVFIVISHIMSCCFVFLGSLSFYNWVSNSKIEDSSFFVIYIASLYFNYATIFTVGYGDILSYNKYEKIYNIVLMIVGLMLYSFALTYISNLITENDRKTKFFDSKKDFLFHLRIKYNLNRKLTEKITRHVIHGIKEKRIDLNPLFSDLSVNLRNEIILNMHKNSVIRFSFFKDITENDFIIKVIMCLKPSKSAKNDELVNQGEYLEEIIFVKKGVLDLDKIMNIDGNIRDNDPILKSKLYRKSISKIAIYNKNLKINYLEKSQNKLKNFEKIKIMKLFSNEHFGISLMIDKKVSPVSIRVKSKTTELFLMNKLDVFKLSNEFPEIFLKIYVKSCLNIKSIINCIQKSKKVITLRKLIANNQNIYYSIMHKRDNELKSLKNMNYVDDSKIKNNNYEYEKIKLAFNSKSKDNFRDERKEKNLKNINNYESSKDSKNKINIEMQNLNNNVLPKKSNNKDFIGTNFNLKKKTKYR